MAHLLELERVNTKRNKEMKKTFSLAAGLVLLGLLTASTAVSQVATGDRNPAPGMVSGMKTLIAFNTMIGLPADLAGSMSTIRDVPPGGLPWKIRAVNGMVRSDGTVRIRVNGLVLNSGENPSQQFAAIISCENTSGAASNVMTRLFRASTTGNAMIRDRVNLPSPCLAPVVFITGPDGSWFAVTGQMAAGTPTPPMGGGMVGR
jgi:hypothetical protein